MGRAQIVDSVKPSAESDDRAARVAERYQAMLRANPTEGVALDRLWKFHEERGTTADLLKSYGDAAASAEADVATLLVHGYLLERTGQPEAAAAMFTRAAAREPTNPLPELASGDLAVARGQPTEAARWYGEALGRLRAGDHRRADLLVKQGNAWFAAGQTAEAAASWEQLAALNPADYALRRRLAEADEKNGLSERAVAEYEFIRDHAGPEEKALALRELGRLHEAQGQFDPARDALENGLALTARDNWLHGDLQTRLIRLYERAGRGAELAARWQAAAEQAPRDLGGYLRLAALAEAEGDPAAERAALEKIVSLNPRDRESTLKLAALLGQAGERERAGALYDALLKTQPGNLALILARADLEVQLGLTEAAVRRVEGRLAQSPADESVVGPALEFFLAHHLDAPAERLLRAEAARQPGSSEAALALAKFLYGQRREGDARTVLAAFAAQPGNAAERAGRFSQVAEAYRRAGATEDALHAWQEAAALLPADPAPLLAVADLQRVRSDTPGAVKTLERAAALSAPGSARLAVERRLFDTLRSSDPAEPGVAKRVRPPSLRGAPVLPAPGSDLGKFLQDLAAKAEERQTVDAYLRLAYWRSWAHDTAGAYDAARKVLVLEPDNLSALELSVEMATQARAPALAEQMLARLMQADPAHSDGATRALATLKLQAGDAGEALKLYESLLARAPGSRTALADLALAQQRADRWLDAVSTWERAMALPGATNAQQAEVRRSLLAAYEHVGQFGQAAALLARAVDEATDLSAREDLFRQWVDLARQHGQLGPLTTRFEEKLRRKPDDYFTLVALAQLRRETGDAAAGYALLQRALYSAPDPAQTLGLLVREAEAIGGTGDAVNYQRRLTGLPGQGTPENLGRLADLQEADQDPDGARRTWTDLAARFPRDPAALFKAAAFFERVEDLPQARQAAAAAVALDGADFPGVLQLAALEERAADPAAALAAYQSILDHTSPEGRGAPFAPPEELRVSLDPLAGLGTGSGEFRLRTVRPTLLTVPAAVTTTGDGDRASRFRAIAGAARLLAAAKVGPMDPGNEKRAAWLAGWRKAVAEGAVNEPLHAFFYGEEKDETLHLLSHQLEAASPEDATVAGAFVLAGLHFGDFGAVGHWVWNRPESLSRVRVAALGSGLERYLSTGGKPGPGMVAGLFPPEADRRNLLWDAAKEFAALHWYATAAELGQRILNTRSSERGAYALEVAEWQLYAGSSDGAHQALRLAVEESGGTTFDPAVSPVMSALRQYYLLLPGPERGPFVADYLGRLRARGDNIQAVLAGVLLHGLAGDEAAARREIDAWLAARLLAADDSEASPEARRWAYVLVNGVQLQSWNLDSLAAYYWRQALGEASGLDRKYGEAEGRQAEIQRRLVATEAALAESPEDARAGVAAYLATEPPTGVQAGVASELMNEDRFAAAIQINKHLCQVEPGDPEHWRRLFTACEATDATDDLESALAGLFHRPGGLPEGLPRAEFVCRWATARERNDDVEGACRVLEAERAEFPGTLPVLLQLAQTYARAGQAEQAATVWRELLPLDPSGTAVLGLAEAEDRLGHRSEAIRRLEAALAAEGTGTQSGIAERLVGFYIQAGRMDDARRLGERLLATERLDALPSLAAAFAAKGQGGEAQTLLAAAVSRARDPNTRYQMQEALIGLLPPVGADARPFLRQLARLETIAKEAPVLRNSIEEAKYKLSRTAGADAVLEADLIRRWQKGKGDYLAGERLSAFYLDTKKFDRLREVIDEFDHRPMLPDQLLFGIEKALVQAEQAPLALPISERLYRRFPQNLEYALERVTTLWKSGQEAAARDLLSKVADTAGLHDDIPEKIALLLLTLGDVDGARRFFEEVVRDDPHAEHSPGSFLQLARLSLENGHPEEADQLLRTAYRQDAADDFEPLVNFLAATGQLAGSKALDMPADDYPLSFRRRARLLVAVATRLKKDGRTGEARELLLRHASFLAEIPAAAAELCQGLPDDERSRVATGLRTAINEVEPPYPRLERLLSGLVNAPAGDKPAREAPAETAAAGVNH